MQKTHPASNKEMKSSFFHKEEGALRPYFSVVRYCNLCGANMKDPRSFIVEYWRSDQTVYFCWCHECGNRWELVEITTISTSELGGEDEGF